MSLDAQKYALTTTNCGIPLVAPMQRYRDRLRRPQGVGVESQEDARAPCVILLLAHGAGFCKEIWEPIIQDLFRINELNNAGRPRLREVWSLDSPNHGEGCTINEDALVKNPGITTIWDYAEAFSALYKSGLLGPLDPKKHKIVLCGHSAGSVAVTLATSSFNPPSMIPFSSIILIDSPMAARNTFGQDSAMYKMVEATTPVRRDQWDSKESASKWMRQRQPWKTWDARMFDQFINYCLRSLPTAFYPHTDGNTGAVTLTTHRLEEFYAFTGKMFTYDATDRLNQICRHVPVHLVYGGRNDMFEKKTQDTLPNATEGRVFASITRVENVGHLVPQEAPTQLAEVIMDILSMNVTFSMVLPKSKI